MLTTTILAAALASTSPLGSATPGLGYTYTYDLSRDVIDLTLLEGAIDVNDDRPQPAGPVETYGQRGTYQVSSVRPAPASSAPILVRTSEEIPLIAIDPTRPIDDHLMEELIRQRPWIRRTDTIKHDLRAARNRYLRQTGQVLTVKTFDGEPSAPKAAPAEPRVEVVYVGDPAALPGAKSEDEKPDPVIRAHDAAADAPAPELKEDSVIRVRPRGS